LTSDLEKNIESLEYELKNARIDLQKEVITTPLEVSRRFEDKETRELARDLQKTKIELSKEVIELLKASLNEKREMVKKSKAKLSEYEGK